jgi:hypothetical protein
VKKIAAIENEKILDKDWFRSHGCALGCDSVCSTGDFAFEHARNSEPKFADASSPDIASTCSPDIANASLPDVGITRNPDVANACNPDIASTCPDIGNAHSYARRYASRKSA